MAAENIRKFEELLIADESLQLRLKALAKCLTGREAGDVQIFEATLGALATEIGLPFSFEEWRQRVSAMRSLDDAELSAVAGGVQCLPFDINDELGHILNSLMTL